MDKLSCDVCKLPLNASSRNKNPQTRPHIFNTFQRLCRDCYMIAHNAQYYAIYGGPRIAPSSSFPLPTLTPMPASTPTIPTSTPTTGHWVCANCGQRVYSGNLHTCTSYGNNPRSNDITYLNPGQHKISDPGHKF